MFRRFAKTRCLPERGGGSVGEKEEYCAGRISTLKPHYLPTSLSPSLSFSWYVSVCQILLFYAYRVIFITSSSVLPLLTLSQPSLKSYSFPDVCTFVWYFIPQVSLSLCHGEKCVWVCGFYTRKVTGNTCLVYVLFVLVLLVLLLCELYSSYCTHLYLVVPS